MSSTSSPSPDTSMSGSQSQIIANEIGSSASNLEANDKKSPDQETERELSQPAEPKVTSPELEQSDEQAAKVSKKNLNVHSRLKPTVFTFDSIITEPVVTSQHNVKGETFFQYDDLPLNRRGYKYRICKPNRVLKANQYSTTELPPFNVRASYFDKSQGVGLSQDMTSITTQNGWLSARCNVPIREGKYYFEFDIVNSNNSDDKAHVRVGIGRKESALDAPVGFDGYGYGLRDLNGQKITLSRPQKFMSEGFCSGDTIGILLELPSLSTQKAANSEFATRFREMFSKSKIIGKAAKNAEAEEKSFNSFDNVLRDQIAIKYKNGLFFEQFEYTRTKQMDHLLNPVTVFGETAVLENKLSAQPTVPTIPGSRMVVFKNGQHVGEMFSDLFSFLPLNISDETAGTDSNTKQQQNSSYRNTDDGSLGYYPMMSVFSDGIVKINGGPSFKHDIPEGAQPLSKRYEECVVEEWLWDLVDEVEAEYLDSFD